VVNITFKNVGQGDSIVLEWEDKLAIIDCNLYNGGNPVLDHLKKNRVKKIEFIILSHPHTDHFSGFHELLSYCIEEDIHVNRFLHTAQSTPAFLKSANRSRESDTKLMALFALLKEMLDNKQIEIYAINDNPDMAIPLGEEFKLEVLSPSSLEIDKYIKKESYGFDEEDEKSNPDANWLSTILKISNSKYYVLLTSDAIKSSFSRIGKRKNSRLKDLKLYLGQSPHHGSKGNLNESFWQIRKRCSNTPIIISVGENHYGHPAAAVTDFFNKTPNYELRQTQNEIIISSTAQNVSRILDTFSTSVNEIHGTDLAYCLKTNTIEQLV